MNNKSALGLGMIVAGGIFQSVGTAGWIVTAFVLIVVGLFIQLLEAIKEFPGTVMIVSHDRHFLRAVTTRVFEVDKNQLRIYEGDYEYYHHKKQQELRA